MKTRLGDELKILVMVMTMGQHHEADSMASCTTRKVRQFPMTVANSWKNETNYINNKGGHRSWKMSINMCQMYQHLRQDLHISEERKAWEFRP